MISTGEAGKIYDEFAVKDLPRHEFIGKLRSLTNQRLIQRDLKGIINQKQESRTRQVLAEVRARKIQEVIR